VSKVGARVGPPSPVQPPRVPVWDAGRPLRPYSAAGRAAERCKCLRAPLALAETCFRASVATPRAPSPAHDQPSLHRRPRGAGSLHLGRSRPAGAPPRVSAKVQWRRRWVLLAGPLPPAFVTGGGARAAGGENSPARKPFPTCTSPLSAGPPRLPAPTTCGRMRRTTTCCWDQVGRGWRQSRAGQNRRAQAPAGSGLAGTALGRAACSAAALLPLQTCRARGTAGSLSSVPRAIPWLRCHQSARRARQLLRQLLASHCGLARLPRLTLRCPSCLAPITRCR